ncbi:MAG: hypothetical protein ACXV3U_04745 [Halobacteriota archaeon]
MDRDEKSASVIGVSSTGSVTFINNDQVAIGQNITQVKKVESLSYEKKEELLSNLKAFKQELLQLDVEEDDKDILKGVVTAAIKETEKQKPDVTDIKSKFQIVVETVKQAGERATQILNSQPAKTIMSILGLVLTFAI